MTEHKPEFQLSINIDDIDDVLAVLSKFYAQEGERRKLAIIVNSQVQVHEEWSYDNWNGGTYGHALYLTVPEHLYLNVIKERNDLQNEIREDINKSHNVQNEFIEVVILEMENVKDRDWRR